MGADLPESYKCTENATNAGQKPRIVHLPARWLSGRKRVSDGWHENDHGLLGREEAVVRERRVTKNRL